MMATTDEKFNAAVKVIHSLPKNGPFQPSYDMMKKFYGYYKQATEGPCNKSKPGFLDVYNKTKWEAWKNLGKMSKEEAMTNYVEELKKIVEAMPQNETVAKFTETLGSFYEIVDDDTPSLKTADDLPSNPPNEYRQASDMENNSGELSNGQSADIFNHSAALEHLIGENIDEADAIPDTEEYDKMLSTSENAERDADEPELDDDSNDSMPSEHIVNDSDTEEEFCDTSDQPSEGSNENAEYEKSNDISQNMSTPLKSKKQGNHVHFDPKALIRTVVDVHENSSCPSPIATPPRGRQLDHVSLSSGFSFGNCKFYDKTRSDSLLVHGPTVESLNASLASQLEEGQDDTSLVDLLTDLNGSLIESVKSHGGGEKFTSHDTGGGGNDLPSQDASRGPRRGGGHGRGVGGRGQMLQQRGGGGRDPGDHSQLRRHGEDVNEQISLALIRLQQDMTNVLTRITDLEVTTKEKQIQEKKEKQSVLPSWWPFHDLSGKTVILVLVWPFMVHWILSFLANKRKRPR